MSYLTNPYRYVIGGCSTYPDSITTTATGVADGVVVNTSAQLFGDGCISFDGTDDFINIDGVSPALQVSTGTISMWYKQPTAQTGYMLMFGDADGDSYINMSVEAGTGDFSMQMLCRRTGTSINRSTKTGLALDVWHNNMLVQDGVSMKLYVDNVEISFS